MDREMRIRDATQSDAVHLARLINFAGEGLPEYLWARAAAGGQNAMQVGAQRAAREDGAFSFRNCRVAVVSDRVAGMSLAYRLPARPEPVEPDGIPAPVRPLLELESRAPGSWYINALATYPEFRGRGIGTALMTCCEADARRAGADTASLIVASENWRAHALYIRLGFAECARAPLVPYPGGPGRGDWLLMTRSLR